MYTYKFYIETSWGFRFVHEVAKTTLSMEDYIQVWDIIDWTDNIFPSWKVYKIEKEAL